MSYPYWSYNTLAAQASTDTYADLKFGDAASGAQFVNLFAETSGPFSFFLRNVDPTNGITYRVLASNDKALADADWVVAVAEAALAAASNKELTLALSYYLFYKVQIKATSGGSQGSVSANAVHKRV